MMENFRSDSAEGYPAAGDLYAFGAFTLSIQEDGDLFYQYQQGTLCSIPGLLSRNMERATTILDTPDTWAGANEMHSGMFRSAGTFRGEARVLGFGNQENMPRMQGLGSDFTVTYDFPEECFVPDASYSQLLVTTCGKVSRK
jgi:hypothetical protein